MLKIFFLCVAILKFLMNYVIYSHKLVKTSKEDLKRDVMCSWNKKEQNLRHGKKRKKKISKLVEILTKKTVMKKRFPEAQVKKSVTKMRPRRKIWRSIWRTKFLIWKHSPKLSPVPMKKYHKLLTWSFQRKAISTLKIFQLLKHSNLS